MTEAKGQGPVDKDGRGADSGRLLVDKHVEYILSLDKRQEEIEYWMTEHLRISGIYWGLVALSLMNKQQALDKEEILLQVNINVDGVVEYVEKSMNYDGGFGSEPGGESHSAQIFTCLAALAIAGKLQIIDRERLSRWLAERQLKSGGLNGRPQKLEDVCYSWWVLSSLKILDRVHWVDKDRLCEFILSAQDSVGGGIADRPGDMADVYHTCFGIAGLSLAGFKGYNLEQVDPVYCMPVSVVKRAGLRGWLDAVPKSWKE
ncbi:Rab geranylgeranyltransferase [Coemansia sp. RSA 1722]|nr:Rab geranylgeranyltransferase [Coemansia sp. RSA 1722]